MSINELIDFLKEIGEGCEDYKMLVAGHPGEIGVTIQKDDFHIDQESKTLFIVV